MPTPFIEDITGLTLVPSGEDITGTVSVPQNKYTMVGVGTAFTTELKKGNYLFIATDNIFVKVAKIINDTVLRIEKPSPVAVEDKAAKQIQARDVRFTTLGIAATEGDATMDGVVVEEGLTVNYSVSESDMERGARFLPPLYFDTEDSATISGTIF